MPHIAGHLPGTTTGATTGTTPPSGAGNGAAFVDFITQNLGQQAAAGTDAFNQAVASGKFANNPEARRIINQSLLGSGRTFTGTEVRDFTPEEQRGVDFFQAAQKPGFGNLLEGIVQTRASTRDAEFERALRTGFFDNNPQATAAANRGLKDQGLQIVNGKLVPLTGITGSEQVREEGTTEAVDIIDTSVTTARGDITGATTSALTTLERGVEDFDPFLQTGIDANQQQAALSGALGPEAQAAAFAAFQESPEQQFLREQGRREVLGSAAATGGLGSGEVLRDLTRFGTGLAAQDFQNQFERLGTVSERGIQAAAGRSGLFGQGAGIQAGAGTDLAGTQLRGGLAQADIVSRAAELTAADRFAAGGALSDIIGETTNAQAALLSGQGIGIANFIGTGSANIASIIRDAGLQLSSSQMQILNQLSNLSVGQATALASQPSVAALLEGGITLGEMGAFLEGVSAFLEPEG